MSSETVREDVPSVASLLVSASSVEPGHKGEPLEVSGWAKWVQSSTRRTLTHFQAKAVDVLCSGFGSPWNCPWDWNNVNWQHGHGVSVCASSHGLATCDHNGLTRLVLAAHEECARVQILPASPRHIRVSVHPRTRDGSLMEGHPTIEEAIAKFRGVAPRVRDRSREAGKTQSGLIEDESPSDAQTQSPQS